jgi:phage FluMu protein Com
MASLLFICPQTHQKVFTGVETGAQSLRASWKTTLKVDCPYCVAVHEITVREAYLDSAIHAATDRLERV